MLNKKAYLNFYTPLDGDALAQSLEKQARKGWHLTKYGDLILHFEKGEPKDTHYAVTFFPDATLYDPKMPEEQETYVDMCAAAGWELVEAKGPMQLFRNDRSNPIPIETDEGYKLQSVHASMKKTFLFSRILLIISMCLNLMTQWQSFRFSAFSVVSSNTSLTIILAILILLVYLVIDLVWYFIWYRLSKNAVAAGGSCIAPLTGLRKGLLWVPLLVTIIMCIVMIADAPSRSARIFYISILLVTFGIIAIVMGLQKWLKKKGFSAKKHRNILIASAVLLALTLCGGMVWFVTHFNLSPRLEEEMDEIIALPEPKLTLTDLMPGPDDAANWRTHQIKRSLLATYTLYIEHDSDGSLEYQLVEIGWDRLRRLVFDIVADRYHFTDGENAQSDSRWGADRAYVYHDRFIALYDDCVLYVDMIPMPDTDQIYLIRQALIE